jgi:phage baseplate assembly protein W
MALPGLEIVDEALQDALGDNVAPFVSSAVKLSENRFKLRQFYVVQHAPGPKRKTMTQLVNSKQISNRIVARHAAPHQCFVKAPAN